MTRSPAASNRLVLPALLALIATVCAQEKNPVEVSGPPKVIVPEAAAPRVDGKHDDEEWKHGAHFALGKGGHALARVMLLRAGRDLYLSCRSEIGPWSVGLRFTIVDPVSEQSMALLVAPLHPPKAPVSLFRTAGRDEMPERVSVATADVRFDLRGAKGAGFVAEMRLPLDLLEIGRTDRSYAVRAELWDLINDRTIALFPLSASGPLLQGGLAQFRPAVDWGSDVVPEKSAPARQPLLVLMEELFAERSAPPALDPAESAGDLVAKPVLNAYLGVADGRRRDAPLAALEARVGSLLGEYPEFFFLHEALLSVLSGRNRLDAALAQVDRIGSEFPVIGHSPPHLLLKAQILFDLGRFADAVAVLDAYPEMLRREPEAAGMRMMIAQRLREWDLEKRIRAEEAKRDDLPRVRLETTRGAIVLELFEDDAPNGVANFLSLVESGFYVGTRFHWVGRAGRVIGGDPNTKEDDGPVNDGFGDPGYLIESEPSRRLHFQDTVAFADKRRQKRTEGSSFFMHIAPFPVLNGRATVFGRIIEGRETLLKLEYYDAITGAKVLRKRDHAYTVRKRAKP